MKAKFMMVLLGIVLIFSACKNETKTASAKDSELFREIIDYNPDQVAAVLMDMNKITLTYFDLGREKSQHEAVKRYAEFSKNQIREIFKKTEIVLRDQGLNPEQNKINDYLVKNIREEGRLLKDTQEEFDVIFIDKITDNLENNLALLKMAEEGNKDEKMMEILRANAQIYDQLLEKAEVLKEKLNY